MISLKTLGPLEVVVDGRTAPRELLWRKNLALLLYLARSPERRRAREHLIGMFWGDKPDASARHSLNEALRVIRRSAGEDVVLSLGDQVVLAPDAVQMDVDDLEALLEAESWAEATGLMQGPFLEGFVVPDSSAFEDWLAAERLTWLARMGEGLRKHSETRLASGDGQAAQQAAVQALALDPFSDAAARLAMLAAAIGGERAGALAIYDEYAGRLSEALGIEPDPETEALADRIRNERQWRLPASDHGADHWARRIPLAGRETELRTILGLMSEAFTSGAPALMVVQGESGSGKTRLGEEVAARARLEGAVVTHIRCVPSDRATPWSGLGGLCHSAGLAESLEPARALTALVRSSGSKQPVMLWIDGAEHLDYDSAAGLQSLVRDLAGVPCVLLLTAVHYPPRDELDDLRARIGRDIPGTALTLGPLAESDLRDLAGHVLPDLDEEAADRVTRRIQVDSAGLPLLAIELLMAVRLGLELDDVGGVWPQPFHTMEQTYPGDLPDSVVAAIRIGYRRLSRPAQSVLAAASVLDERSDAARFAAATALEREVVHDALDELEWNRWLVAEKRGYAFVARIVRDVVARDMLTPGQRRRIRERISAE